MAALSRAAFALSALALACAGPAAPDGGAEVCPWGRPGCAGAAAEADEAAHLQVQESAQQGGRRALGREPASEQCPGSGPETMCAGDQCCPGTAASGGKTFPCPTASDGWNECQGPAPSSTSWAPSWGGQGGQSGCPGYDVSGENYDYGGQTLKTVNGAVSTSTCCSACTQYGKGCGGWSFYAGVCYLKPPHQGEFYYHAGRVAGKKRHHVHGGYASSGPNTDLGGQTIAEVPVHSEAQCPMKCDAHDGCGGYAYYQQVCYLKPCGQSFYGHPGRVAAKKC